MKMIFFDTETTGKIQPWTLPPTEFKKYPRIVSLAYEVTDEKFNVIESGHSIIHPDGSAPSSAEAFYIHGITEMDRIMKGKRLKDVLNEFWNLVGNCDYFVAHNLEFDLKMVSSETKRLRLPYKFPETGGICTMKIGKDMVKLPHRRKNRDGYKNPKLAELYRFIFDEDFENAHDAAADVTACRKCFERMVQYQSLNILKL